MAVFFTAADWSDEEQRAAIVQIMRLYRPSQAGMNRKRTRTSIVRLHLSNVSLKPCLVSGWKG